MRTHPVDKLLEQYCHKSVAGLLQRVRFTCVGNKLSLIDLFNNDKAISNCDALWSIVVNSNSCNFHCKFLIFQMSYKELNYILLFITLS